MNNPPPTPIYSYPHIPIPVQIQEAPQNQSKYIISPITATNIHDTSNDKAPCCTQKECCECCAVWLASSTMVFWCVPLTAIGIAISPFTYIAGLFCCDDNKFPPKHPMEKPCPTRLPLSLVFCGIVCGTLTRDACNSTM